MSNDSSVLPDLEMVQVFVTSDAELDAVLPELRRQLRYPFVLSILQPTALTNQSEANSASDCASSSTTSRLH